MAVISQSESNFKQRQRALSGRLDRGELQTSQEIKAWITFSRLPRDKKRPHLFAGLNFSATERNKKAKLSFCSSSPSSNAITDWLAELKSTRCSAFQEKPDQWQEVISRTSQFISVVLPAAAESQTYLSGFFFQTRRRGCSLSTVLCPQCNSAADRSDSGLLTANAARKTSPWLLHPLSSQWGRSHLTSCPSSCQVTSQLRVEGRDFITGQSSCSSSFKMCPTLCSLSLRLLLGASQLLPVCTSFPVPLNFLPLIILLS